MTFVWWWDFWCNTKSKIHQRIARDTQFLYAIRKVSRDFLGGPVVRILCFHCRAGWIPGQGTAMPQAAWCSQKKKKGVQGSADEGPHQGACTPSARWAQVQHPAQKQACFLPACSAWLRQLPASLLRGEKELRFQLHPDASLITLKYSDTKKSVIPEF